MVGLTHYLEQRRFAPYVGTPTFLTYLFRYTPQREGFSHNASALPDLTPNVLVRVPEALTERCEAVRLFPGRQVLPLHVLYEGYLRDALCVRSEERRVG